METNGFKNKALSINVASVTLWILAIFSIGDVVTTLIEYNTSPVFNETNPLVILLGVPIYLLLFIKMILIIYIIYFSLKLYKTKNGSIMRYVFVYLVVILTLLHIGAVINNINVINTPTELKEEIPDDIKVEIYKEGILEMGLVKPKIVQTYPPMILIFILNLIQFIVWRSFEKWMLIK